MAIYLTICYGLSYIICVRQAILNYPAGHISSLPVPKDRPAFKHKVRKGTRPKQQLVLAIRDNPFLKEAEGRRSFISLSSFFFFSFLENVRVKQGSSNKDTCSVIAEADFTP